MREVTSFEWLLFSLIIWFFICFVFAFFLFFLAWLYRLRKKYILKKSGKRLSGYTQQFSTVKITLFTLISFVLIFVIGAVLFIASWLYIAIPNYYGYCSRNGSNLTKKQRLDIAIERYLHEQYHDYHSIRYVEQREVLPKIKFEKYFRIIPYKNKEEFLKINPECCELEWYHTEKFWFGFWERAEGSGNGIFNFKHKIRYQLPDGSVRMIDSKNMYYQVNNCGEPQCLIYR